MKDFEKERRELVESLRKKGKFDEKVLEAVLSVQREKFLQAEMLDCSYLDNALPIECGQTISQPYTVAYMTNELSLDKGSKVLEIGTGSGYQSAILAALDCDIYSIERIEYLHNKVKKLFIEMGIKANLFLGDGSNGLPDYAPFDRIIVTAAVPRVPKLLLKQLLIGGKMVLPVGNRKSQTMVLVNRLAENKYDIQKLDTFRFVPLIGQAGWKDTDDEEN